MSHFPLTNLWDGIPCGREQECTTCYQGAEILPNCTRQSLLYENVCATCIPGAKGKEPLKEEDVDPENPAIYVGETSRSILERSREHWKAYKGKKEDSHIWKHQTLKHNGEQADFIMRVVGSKRTALERQISEAVRIRRRGGAGSILNSKTEYNRCHIPRLRVEDEEETKKREDEQNLIEEQIEIELDMEQATWELERTKERDRERLLKVGAIRESGATVGGGSKRMSREQQQNSKGKKRSKRRKLELLGEDWGAMVLVEGGTPTTGEQQCSTTTTLQEEEASELGAGAPPEMVTASWAERVLTQQEITRFLVKQDNLATPRAMNQTVSIDNIMQEKNISTDEGQHDQFLDSGCALDDQQRGLAAIRLEDDQQEELTGSKDDKEGILTTPSMVRSNNDMSKCLEEDDLSGRDEPGGGTPSDVGTSYRNELEQTDEKCEVGTTKMTNSDDVPNDGGSKTADKCQFKRGVCTLHKTKGNKMVRTKKSWVKKKNGLCGWNTSKVVYYTCSWNMSDNNPTQSTGEPVGGDLCRSPDLKQQQQQGVKSLFRGDGIRISGAVLGEEEKVLR